MGAKTHVIADARPVGVCAVLVQEQKEQQRVISYASRSLTDVERRYSQTKKEAKFDASKISLLRVVQNQLHS